MIKNRTGDTIVAARAIRSSKTNHKFFGYITIYCNEIPSISTSDTAILRRILSYPFVSIFVNNEKERKKYLKKGYKYVFIKDRNMKSKIEEIYGMQYLYELGIYYAQLMKNDYQLYESNLIKRRIRKFMLDNNKFYKWWKTVATKTSHNHYIQITESTLLSKFITSIYYKTLPISTKSSRPIDVLLQKIMQDENLFNFQETYRFRGKDSSGIKHYYSRSKACVGWKYRKDDDIDDTQTTNNDTQYMYETEDEEDTDLIMDINEDNEDIDLHMNINEDNEDIDLSMDVNKNIDLNMHMNNNNKNENITNINNNHNNNETVTNNKNKNRNDEKVTNINNNVINNFQKRKLNNLHSYFPPRKKQRLSK